MAQTRFLAVVFAFLAMSLLAEAQKSKTFTVKLVATAGQDNSAKLGDTGVLVRDLVEGGKVYQSGVYVDVNSKAKLLNYQITVVVDGNGGDFPKGQIFAVGSGTGVQDDSVVTPKTVVGGTGPYANARGTIDSKDNKMTITLF